MRKICKCCSSTADSGSRILFNSAIGSISAGAFKYSNITKVEFEDPIDWCVKNSGKEISVAELTLAQLASICKRTDTSYSGMPYKKQG